MTDKEAGKEILPARKDASFDICDVVGQGKLTTTPPAPDRFGDSLSVPAHPAGPIWPDIRP